MRFLLGVKNKNTIEYNKKLNKTNIFDKINKINKVNIIYIFLRIF